MSKTQINEKTQMRDAVIGRLYDLSEHDDRLVFCAADQGGMALDKWRKREEKLKDGRFNEFGIAEQAMVSTAAGMAKEGKRPFIYAIANFITKRILEFHILNAGVQNLPYVTLGVGTGFSYGDSGPTHYMTEDISIMRTIPNLEILSPSDSVMAGELAEKVAKTNNPAYIRMDRSVLPIINSPFPIDSYDRGFNEIRRGLDTCLISTGNMVHNCLQVRDMFQKTGENLGLIDVYRLKPLNTEGLLKTLNNYDRAVTVEEHLLSGGLGSMVSELVTDHSLSLQLRRIGIDDKLVYHYGRENIQKELALDPESIYGNVSAFLQKQQPLVNIS